MKLQSFISPSLAATLLAVAFASIMPATASPVIDAEHAGYKVLHSLQASEGSHPMGALDDVGTTRLFGTASDGGYFGLGTIFKLTKSGRLTVVQAFSGQGFYRSGEHPKGGVSRGRGGRPFYTSTSGAPSYVVNMNARHGGGRKLNFMDDGASPTGSLIEGASGAMFGTAEIGGRYGAGSVIQASGYRVTAAHWFNGTDGNQPHGALVLAPDGKMFGTTWSGGANGLGTIFSLDSSLHFASLHSFSSDECSSPVGDLLDIDGDLYGVCSAGGRHGVGAVFKYSAAGTLTILHEFGSPPHDGAQPLAGMALGPAPGILFGTTSAGGSNGVGTVFAMTMDGDLKILHSFCACDGDGYHPAAQLHLAADGRLYGTTMLGGAYDDSGTIFVLRTP
jgi:uncharacterized repeat protein (TIGR03803 family)